jgi:hypothetical protein
LACLALENLPSRSVGPSWAALANVEFHRANMWVIGSDTVHMLHLVMLSRDDEKDEELSDVPGPFEWTIVK